MDNFDKCSIEDRNIILRVLRISSSSRSSVLKVFLSSRQDAGIELGRVFNSNHYRAMDCAENHVNIGTYIKLHSRRKLTLVNLLSETQASLPLFTML